MGRGRAAADAAAADEERNPWSELPQTRGLCTRRCRRARPISFPVLRVLAYAPPVHAPPGMVGGGSYQRRCGLLLEYCAGLGDWGASCLVMGLAQACARFGRAFLVRFSPTRFFFLLREHVR